MLEDVGRCWKIGLKPGKINSLTRGSSTNESQVTSPSLIFHLVNFANVSNYRNGTVLLERTLPCQMWLQMAVHLALVWASSGWFSTSCGHAQHQNSQNPQCSGQIEKYVFFVRLAKYIQIQSPWFECRSANLIQFKDNFGNYQWPIPLTENKNVKKGSIVKGHVYQFYHTLTHTKHHILDIQPESSGLCCFSLTLRPGTRENSGELDKYLTARDYSCGFLHIDVVDNVGRCWKMLEDWSETREN